MHRCSRTEHAPQSPISAPMRLFVIPVLDPPTESGSRGIPTFNSTGTADRHRLGEIEEAGAPSVGCEDHRPPRIGFGWGEVGTDGPERKIFGSSSPETRPDVEPWFLQGGEFRLAKVSPKPDQGGWKWTRWARAVRSGVALAPH